MSQPAEVTPNSVPDAASPLRFVTAASLFDGHDAAINIMRRLIQARGVEVIHLGHNRSVQDIVDAAVQEDADAIAVSSYQGGHTEYFRYMVDLLRERGAGHIRIFGGGGGTITPEEIIAAAELREHRVFADRLDPLGEGFEAQLFGHRQDRRDHRGGIRADRASGFHADAVLSAIPQAVGAALPNRIESQRTR